MTARGLWLLAALAVVSLAAAAAVLRGGPTTIASDRRGEPVLPGLAAKVNDITGLTVRQHSDTLAVDPGPSVTDTTTAGEKVAHGATVVSTAHGHGPPCSGIRKVVDFTLTPGRYVVQLTTGGDPVVGVIAFRR